MARTVDRFYGLFVNPNASSATGKEHGGGVTSIKLLVGGWEEEAFLPTIHGPITDNEQLSDWDSIEAVGAADDPARFRVDVDLVEMPDVCAQP